MILFPTPVNPHLTLFFSLDLLHCCVSLSRVWHDAFDDFFDADDSDDFAWIRPEIICELVASLC